MNWGKWIIVAFISFTAFIGTLVTVCVRQDISLVSKNYYQDELAFDNQIARLQNVSALQQKPAITKGDGMVEVSFDRFIEMEQGTLTLFRPSDASKDRTFALEQRNAVKQSFPVSELERGMYRARIQWTMGTKEYFFEEIIYL
jgi:hypothetical protein